MSELFPLMTPNNEPMKFSGQNTPKSIEFYAGDINRLVFTITGTPTGFNVHVSEGITMNECAEAFVNALRYNLKDLKP